MSTRVEVRESLKCGSCGDRFECSARYARGIRRGDYPQKCRPCAKGAPRKPYADLCVTQAQTRGPVTDRERRWCLERFSDDEILEFAEMLSGSPGDIENVRTWREALAVREPVAA